MSSTSPPPADQTWPDDAGYLGRTVTLAGEVTNSLPPGTPMSWRRLAYRAVLGAVLRDAIENDTNTLDPDDTANLTRFVQDAASAASLAGVEHRDDAFEIVLNALLEDWVDNWDTGGDEEEDEEDEEDDD